MKAHVNEPLPPTPSPWGKGKRCGARLVMQYKEMRLDNPIMLTPQEFLQGIPDNLWAR